ncbi:MAG: hypothetical protein ACYC61_27270 [Isosphaeraceae bacterium]
MSTTTIAAGEGDGFWSRSSTCRAIEAEGHELGRAYGLAESTSRTLATLLGRQARVRFGGADPAGRATLDGLAQSHATTTLAELGERLVGATGWNDWLAGIDVPPPAPGLPDYTRGLEINLDPTEPSIDTYMQMGLRDGGTTILHLRLQKTYQPDLDRHLFENSLKVERKHGLMPMVCVILMWPPAEGPGMTGRYEQRDAADKVISTFTYRIDRAWQLPAEEFMQGPSTMMLAPLTRGARERMPEIVRMMSDRLKQSPSKPETIEKLWTTVYWHMGLVCDVDEVHRALGDLLPRIQNMPGYLAAKGHAFLESYSAAQHEGRLIAARDLVRRQVALRFGQDADADAAIASIDEPSEFEALADRALTAHDWASLMARSNT